MPDARRGRNVTWHAIGRTEATCHIQVRGKMLQQLNEVELLTVSSDQGSACLYLLGIQSLLTVMPYYAYYPHLTLG